MLVTGNKDNLKVYDSWKVRNGALFVTHTHFCIKAINKITRNLFGLTRTVETSIINQIGIQIFKQGKTITHSLVSYGADIDYTL